MDEVIYENFAFRGDVSDTSHGVDLFVKDLALFEIDANMPKGSRSCGNFKLGAK